MKRVLRHSFLASCDFFLRLEYLPYEEGITTRRGGRPVALVPAPPQQDRAYCLHRTLHIKHSI